MSISSLSVLLDSVSRNINYVRKMKYIHTFGCCARPLQLLSIFKLGWKLKHKPCDIFAKSLINIDEAKPDS